MEETGKGKKGCEGNQRAMGSLEFIAQDTEPKGTTLVDARNGFNELSRLAVLWTVWHCWTAGLKFVFNCYRHSVQLLLRQSQS